MKVYFKESPEEEGDEGKLKGRLLYLGKSQLQNKTVLYLQRKTHGSFSLVPEKQTYSHIIPDAFTSLLAFTLCPPT